MSREGRRGRDTQAKVSSFGGAWIGLGNLKIGKQNTPIPQRIGSAGTTAIAVVGEGADGAFRVRVPHISVAERPHRSHFLTDGERGPVAQLPGFVGKDGGFAFLAHPAHRHPGLLSARNMGDKKGPFSYEG